MGVVGSRALSFKRSCIPERANTGNILSNLEWHDEFLVN